MRDYETNLVLFRNFPPSVTLMFSSFHPFRFVWLLSAVLILGCSSQETAQTAEPPAKPKEPAKAKPNRLAKETSPYLLMHAHNPVDWYPWGPEALKKAKDENKPIFLSVGYSSCHWCHVMERESFLDKEIAELLNKHFVCIKVDREERPDVDAIYMMSLHVYNQLTGSNRGGGWPLSMFLTPNTQPFFGGTYFPARDGDRGASTGFLTIADKVRELWAKEPQLILDDAEQLTKFVRRELEGRSPAPLEPLDGKVIGRTLEALALQYDPEYGGFGYSPDNPYQPKFPEPSNLLFLLDHIRRTDDATAKKQLIGTLQGMAQGGLQDHLGGGFHRYSVDRFWRIPHFEKMLYDNGQLASVYAEAYELTETENFRRVVEELMAFVEREMTSPEGGFYSALDAESEHEEGKFYRWEKAEVEKLLNSAEFSLFSVIYGINQAPNFEEKYYAPQLKKPLAEWAAQKEISETKLAAQLAPIRDKLMEARGRRPRPLTDTKILTSWNGLMIRGAADAGRILKRPEYVKTAAKAADFVLAKLKTEDGRLLRTYSQGRAKYNAYLDDYAFLVNGLLALHRADQNPRWLEEAEKLTAKQIELFWDDKAGGFFFTSKDHEALLARGKNPVDGARPAGISVSAENLLFLAKTREKPEYLERARKTLGSVASLLKSRPSAAPRAVTVFVALQEMQEAEKKE